MKLSDMYYRVRRKLHLQEVSPERIKALNLLYPDRNPKEVAREQDEKLLRMILLVLAVGIVLSISVLFADSVRKNVESIIRKEPGKGNTRLELVAEYEGEEIPIEVSVNSRQYTEEEIDELFESSRAEMFQIILGENESPDYIDKNLNLELTYLENGTECKWRMSEVGLVTYAGVLIEPERFEGGYKTSAELRISYGAETRRYQTELTLYPPSGELSAAEQIEAKIKAADSENPYDRELVLPNQMGDSKLDYLERKEGGTAAGIILLILLVMGLLIFREKEELKNEKKSRDEQLESEYPVLVSKLAVLIGAGLSIRKAWERIVEDYKKSKAETKPLYEEMNLAMRRMGQGYTEEEALTEFGKRIGLNDYLRFIGTLESQRKNGKAELLAFLRDEANGALEKSLTVAKRRGEKMSSKLLVPMILLFAIVLALLIIPAFISW
ncbi:MAG: type II secretion system F family protein [Lachnospiraceae bacterium]|nr:type II secretion system F family protein [Candidatus Minthocola equi]